MIKGFREFILRGNVIDLAVAVVIGAAFTAVVNAIVSSIINPLIAIFWKPDANGTVGFPVPDIYGGTVTFPISDLINAVISFIAVAIVVWWAVVAGLAFGVLPLARVPLRVALVVALMPLRLWASVAYPIYVAGVIMLVMVDINGVVVNGAERWLKIAGDFRIQPSELMKLAVPLALAKLTTSRLPSRL